MVNDPLWLWPALKTLAVLGVLAVAYWPLTTRLLRNQPDRGAAWALPGGLFGFLLTAQILWLLGLGHIDTGSLWIAVSIPAVTGWWTHTTFNGSEGTRARMRSAGCHAAGLFCLLFLFWALIRSADPGISHTEQPMDLMWMRAAMASDFPPVRDAWFGNAPATYYTGGHQALAFLSNLTGEPAPVGYNLGQITWFALTGLLIVLCARRMLPGRPGRTAGRLALILILFASTPAGLLHALKNPDLSTWWWWDASRVLADNGTALITEFPFFSFWLGDNHAHLLGLPILLLALGAARELQRTRQPDWTTTLPLGLALIWSWQINPWQAPTVLAISAIGILSRRHLPAGKRWPGLFAGGLAPFLLLLQPSASGLFKGVSFEMDAHTNPVEVLQVFGWMAPGIPGLLLIRRNRLPALLLLLCAGLLLSCEVVRVVDAFDNRMNTVFKVYYQVWLLLGLTAAIGWAAALHTRSSPVVLMTLLLPALACFYAARLSGYAVAKSSRNLDALAAESPDTRLRLRLVDQFIQPGDRIAEAPGDSYHPSHNQLGTWTAGASIYGWRGHQAQWRPGHHPPWLLSIYSADNAGALMESLEHLGVDWVWLGRLEQEQFAIHPDLPRWLDTRFNRLIDQPEGSLWQIK